MVAGGGRVGLCVMAGVGDDWLCSDASMTFRVVRVAFRAKAVFQGKLYRMKYCRSSRFLF